MSRPPEMSLEARSGLPAWKPADLPNPPTPRGLQWVGVVGPGVIVLGASIGSGEFLLGPAVFVKYGLTLLWVTGVSVFLQTIFNTELMRYTVATGEPVVTGFMRTRPSSTFWKTKRTATSAVRRRARGRWRTSASRHPSPATSRCTSR